MDRRSFFRTVALGIVATPLSAGAQQVGRVARIGVLWFTFPSISAPFFDALRTGLRDLGYIEGQAIAFEQRWAEKNPHRYPELASELVRLKVDIIVAGNLESARAAQVATTTIPIILTAGGDPVRAGLVSSLARPGGNITGLSELGPDLAPKLLQFLKEAIPRLSKVAVLWDPSNPSQSPTRQEIESAARTLRSDIVSLEVAVPEEFEKAFATVTRERPDALIVYTTPITYSHRIQIIDFAARRRLPTIYSAREFVDAGGLMSYGPDLRTLFRRAASYVDRILKGTKAADLPVEQPTTFELVINGKTAKALGLTIPPSLLVRADHVIE
jgi:putative tryptophan/tyrosine transport system substrate-binding protein